MTESSSERAWEELTRGVHRGREVSPGRDTGPPASGRLRRAEALHSGRCFHCGAWVEAIDSEAWQELLNGPCPKCGLKGW